MARSAQMTSSSGSSSSLRGDGRQAPGRREVRNKLDPGLKTPSSESPMKRGNGKNLPNIDRRQAWQEVARRVGGTFEEGRWKSQDRVAVEHGAWSIRLDTYTVHKGQVSVTYTRAGGLLHRSGRSEAGGPGEGVLRHDPGEPGVRGNHAPEP